MPKVFISYSHDSVAHKDQVLALSNKLRREGVECFIDRYINGFPAEGWITWMRNQIEAADFVLVVCTEIYKQRYEGKAEVDGRGVTFEGAIIAQTLYQAFQKNKKFIPLIPDGGSFGHVPIELNGWNVYRLDEEYESYYRILTNQPATSAPPLGKIRNLGTVRGDDQPRQTALTPLPELPAHEVFSSANNNPIVVDKLPTVQGEFFGRKVELALLNNTLNAQPKTTSIIQFIAPGGTGKTKLLRHWLDQHQAQIPNRIIWSFYSQGTTESRQVSLSPLLSEAFKAFGVDASQYKTDEDRADALFDLLLAHQCLLVLDGLEPMQQFGRGMDGRLKDRAMARLLKKLASQNTVLCIITTRIKVYEVSDRASVVSYDLNNLAINDGMQLLRSLHVQGREQQLHSVVTKVQGHALTLHLIGNAIHTHLGGDAFKLDTLAEWFDEDEPAGQHAFRVMAEYERCLRDEQGQPLPELQLLYLLGLFDHPIEREVLEVLWKAKIPGLTAPKPMFWTRVFKNKNHNPYDQKQWQSAIAKLTDHHRLLSQHVDDGNSNSKNNHLLDCHPLIREYFGQQLQRNHPKVWQQSHQTLYQFYKNLPAKEQPDSLDEMRPLFAAVAHGCAAGLHQQALDEVYWPRISREQEAYIVNNLGAFSDALAVVAHFFTEPWRAPAPALTPVAKALVFNWAGFRLRALGRLGEALEPMMAGLEMRVAQEHWRNAARAAGTLSELQLTLGDVPAAVHSSKQAVDYAERSGEWSVRMFSLTSHADALHQAGEAGHALALFNQAEQLQEEWQPQNPRLYSLQGFQYCDLLLSQAGQDNSRPAEVVERASTALKVAEQHGWLLDMALDQLTLARANLQQNNLPEASQWLEKAIDGLRAAGAMEFLTLGLLTRATLHRLEENYDLAQQDLNEVFEIAEPSGMRLHLTDYHLESAQLAHAQGKPREAIEHHLTRAAQLIEATGYHRRDQQLVELQATLLGT